MFMIYDLLWSGQSYFVLSFLHDLYEQVSIGQRIYISIEIQRSIGGEAVLTDLIAAYTVCGEIGTKRDSIA